MLPKMYIMSMDKLIFALLFHVLISALAETNENLTPEFVNMNEFVSTADGSIYHAGNTTEEKIPVSYEIKYPIDIKEDHMKESLGKIDKEKQGHSTETKKIKPVNETKSNHLGKDDSIIQNKRRIASNESNEDIDFGPNDYFDKESFHSFPDTATKATNKSDSNIIYEWETHMQNFIPEMLVTFKLDSRSDEYFYEEVGIEPVYLRGGYFVSGDEDQADVDFTITDPAGDVIYKKTHSEGLFYFYTKLPGTYSFIISNNRWMESKIVTFAIGKGNVTTLQSEHVSNVEQRITTIDQQLKDAKAESQYLWIRQRSHMASIENMNRRVLWFALVELLCLTCVVTFQIYYIKGLVSDKRIL